MLPSCVLLSDKKKLFLFFLGSCTFLYFLLDFVSRMSNKSVSIFIFFLGLAVLKGIQNTEERHLKTTSLDIETTYKKTEAENPGILVTYTQLQQAASKFQPTDFRPTNPKQPRCWTLSWTTLIWEAYHTSASQPLSYRKLYVF